MLKNIACVKKSTYIYQPLNQSFVFYSIPSKVFAMYLTLKSFYISCVYVLASLLVLGVVSCGGGEQGISNNEVVTSIDKDSLGVMLKIDTIWDDSIIQEINYRKKYVNYTKNTIDSSLDISIRITTNSIGKTSSSYRIHRKLNNSNVNFDKELNLTGEFYFFTTVEEFSFVVESINMLNEKDYLNNPNQLKIIKTYTYHQMIESDTLNPSYVDHSSSDYLNFSLDTSEWVMLNKLRQAKGRVSASHDTLSAIEHGELIGTTKKVSRFGWYNMESDSVLYSSSNNDIYYKVKGTGEVIYFQLNKNYLNKNKTTHGRTTQDSTSF